MRALERHPEDRYQTAYDLADDLESFLRDEKLHSGPVRIARYLDMLTIAAGGTRRPELISEAEARARRRRSRLRQPGVRRLRADRGRARPRAGAAVGGRRPARGRRRRGAPPRARRAARAAHAGAGASVGDDAGARRLAARPRRGRRRGGAVAVDQPGPADEDRRDRGEGGPDDDGVPTQPVTPPPPRSPAPPAPSSVAAAFAPRPAPPPIPRLTTAPPRPPHRSRARRSAPRSCQRSGGSKLPWLLVAALAVAVVSLLAYIVMR